MIDLCTVTNTKFIKNAIKLAESYTTNNYSGNIFVYYFNISDIEINNYKLLYPHIKFIEIPKFCDYAYNPRIFAYKSFALLDCITNRSDSFLYSDATNLINLYMNIETYFLEDRLLLPYNDEKLTNKYWTTNICLNKINNNKSNDSIQYWAGLQGYKNNTINVKLLTDQYNYMLDPDIAFPDPSMRYPDGQTSLCIEHRQDQSVLSILIDKYHVHQSFDMEKQKLFGDYQTYQLFDSSYIYNPEKACILSRYTKNNLS
jgi:hypothetical protein